MGFSCFLFLDMLNHTPWLRNWFASHPSVTTIFLACHSLPCSQIDLLFSDYPVHNLICCFPTIIWCTIWPLNPCCCSQEVCQKYWPDEGESATESYLAIQHVKEDDQKEYIVRDFQLTNTKVGWLMLLVISYSHLRVDYSLGGALTSDFRTSKPFLKFGLANGKSRVPSD